MADANSITSPPAPPTGTMAADRPISLDIAFAAGQLQAPAARVSAPDLSSGWPAELPERDRLYVQTISAAAALGQAASDQAARLATACTRVCFSHLAGLIGFEPALWVLAGIDRCAPAVLRDHLVLGTSPTAGREPFPSLLAHLLTEALGLQAQIADWRPLRESAARYVAVREAVAGRYMSQAARAERGRGRSLAAAESLTRRDREAELAAAAQIRAIIEQARRR